MVESQNRWDDGSRTSRIRAFAKGGHDVHRPRPYRALREFGERAQLRVIRSPRDLAYRRWSRVPLDVSPACGQSGTTGGRFAFFASMNAHTVGILRC